MAINRPNLPYIGVARQNDNYFKLLTSNSSGVPYESLDGYFNFFTDQVNDIYTAIAGVNIGNLPGINDPSNASKLLTTNGAGTQNWVFVQASNILISSITGDRLSPQTVTTAQLGNACVGPNQLASDAVTSIKILNGNVTNEKLAADAVTEVKIADDAVTTDKILDANVTTDKILNANVTTAKIADANVTTAKILDANVTTPKIADGAVTLAKMAADVIKVAASKAQQIAGTSSNVYTSPLFQQNHPSAAKFLCSFNGSTAGTNAPLSGYNVATITRTATGTYTINFTVPFSNTDYTIIGNSQSVPPYYAINLSLGERTTTSCVVYVSTYTNVLFDVPFICVGGYGLQ